MAKILLHHYHHCTNQNEMGNHRMIHIQYFGRLQDDLHCKEESIAWASGNSLDLLTQLQMRDSVWAEALAEEKIFKIAINNVFIHQHQSINAGDHIAFLPPVTGG